MIKPEPGSFAELLAELLVERYGPTRRVRAERVDSPAVIARRRRELNEAMEEPASGRRLAKVVPLPVKREKAA